MATHVRTDDGAVAVSLPAGRRQGGQTLWRRLLRSPQAVIALVILLTLIFSPLSFNYAYVWLLYPTTVAVHRVLSEPADPRSRRTRLEVVWLATVLLVPALAIPMPQVAQACGNLFGPAVLLVLGLGAMLRTACDIWFAGTDTPGRSRASRQPLPTATWSECSRSRLILCRSSRRARFRN